MLVGFSEVFPLVGRNLMPFPNCEILRHNILFYVKTLKIREQFRLWQSQCHQPFHDRTRNKTI